MSPESMSESFYMSNMSPQVPGFNRGIWKKLEAQVREWVVEFGSLYIVTGIIVVEGYETIGDNEVAVPQFYYKVLMDYTETELKAIGFILPNEKYSVPLRDYAVTVDEVELRTGVDFFYVLDDEVEDNLESNIDIEVWF